MNNKIYKKLFVGFGFVSIVLILTLFIQLHAVSARLMVV